MTRNILTTTAVLLALSSSSSAENYSGSFLRKRETINLIGPQESLVASFPLDRGRLKDWRFEGKEEEGAVIAVDSSQFSEGSLSGFFSPHRVFGDFRAEFEVEAASQKSLRFLFGMNRAARKHNAVILDPDSFGRCEVRIGVRKGTVHQPTAAELDRVPDANVTWNRIGISFTGGKLVVSMNGMEIVTHQIPEAFGAIGLASNGKARMKSRIDVTSLMDPDDFPEVPITSAGTMDRHPGMKWIDFGMLQEMDHVGAYCASVTRIENLSAKRWRHDFTRTYGLSITHRIAKLAVAGKTTLSM